MNEREALRAKATDLYQRLRKEDVPHVLFELLDVILARLDRIELGEFSDPNEVPTEPGKNLRSSTASFPAVREEKVKPDEPHNVGELVKDIFEKAKKGDKQKP